MRRHVKVALCLPWYAGPDRDTSGSMLAFQHYLGRVQERSWWMAHAAGINNAEPLPKLDIYDPKGRAEFPAELVGTTFEFAIAEEVGCSLPGMARERCVDAALAWGADYCLFYDDDMLFPNDAFLTMYQAQKDVVAALAFTSREPITPVIYRFKEYKQEISGVGPRITVDIEPILDYKRDALQKVDAVGAGMVLINTRVFQKLKKPYFNSPGLGEDIFFCLMCKREGIEVYVDTRVKTIHKPAFAQTWHDERSYDAQQLVLASMNKEKSA